MIEEAVGYIRREVKDFLGVPDAEVIIGNVHTLKDDTNSRGVYISLVNIEEESTFKNTPHYSRQNGSTRYQEPPVFLNLYLLFAFDFADYDASLVRLSRTIERFQSKPTFSSQNETLTNAFPPTLERLTLDFHNLNLEQLNHMWGVLGGAYFPSVLYKVRLVRVQRDESTAAPEITVIEMETNPK